MTIENVKCLLDTCFLAKKITESMPKLPSGLKPRHIHVIESIAKLGEAQSEVCISDVSGNLNITTPSVTKLINELEALEIVNKYPQKKDKRVTLVKLTKLGTHYEKQYVECYHNYLAKELSNIEDKEAETVNRVIGKFYEIVHGGVEIDE